MLSGTYMPLGDVMNSLGDLTGRKIRFATLPVWSLWPIVWFADMSQRVLPFRLPISRDGCDDFRLDVHCDDTQTKEELDIKFRDLRRYGELDARIRQTSHEIRRPTGRFGSDELR